MAVVNTSSGNLHLQHSTPNPLNQALPVNMDTATREEKTIRVGAVQAEPVWHDLDGCVDKTIQLIKQAAADGVQVLGFPEVWIPGYPW